MVSRFRKERTTVPAVWIKVGKRCLATTIGWDRSPVRRGVDGLALRHVGDPRLSGPLPTDRFLIPGTRKDFGDGDVTDMTSPGLGSFKELLIATRQRQKEIKAEINKATWQLRLNRLVQALGWVSLACIAPPIRKRTGTALAVTRSDLAVLTDNLNATRISVNFDMESEVAEPHRMMQSAFDRMAASQRAWSVQTEQQIDRVKARTLAGTAVERAPTFLRRLAASLVDTQDLPLAMQVLRGKATAYFYPGFVLVDRGSGSDFALVDLTEIAVNSGVTHFTETEGAPSDAEVVGTTWAKANKNGTRDRRFKDNRELPIMRYGSLSFSSAGGINEALMFSDAEASARFSATVNDLKRLLARGRANSLPVKPPMLDRPR